MTERAVAKTSEKVKKSRSSRSLRRVAHFNKHGFENTADGAQHISGIYQYLDKVCRMRLMNYGPRFFYEFLVASPGAFLRELGKGPAHDLPREPRKPSVRPDSITPRNYETYLRNYGITSASPPPQSRMLAAVTMNDSDSGSGGPQSFRKEDKLTIPPIMLLTNSCCQSSRSISTRPPPQSRSWSAKPVTHHPVAAAPIAV